MSDRPARETPISSSSGDAEAVEAARRIIAFNGMNGNAENDSIDEVCVARALLSCSSRAAQLEKHNKILEAAIHEELKMLRGRLPKGFTSLEDWATTAALTGTTEQIKAEARSTLSLLAALSPEPPKETK